MQLIDDYYPTRLEEPKERFERLDPIVYSEGAQQRSGPLSEAQLREYEEKGFLVFDSFFSEQETQEFLRDMEGYSKDAELKKLEQVITEPTGRDIRSIFGVHKISERFDRLTRNQQLLDIAAQLLGSDVYIHQSRMNVKPGFTGTGFNWHSDFETWHSEDGMPRMRCFSLSILLTENNEFNGPLQLVPGSHKWFIPTQGSTPTDNWKESLKVQTLGVPAKEDLFAMTRAGGIEAPKGPPGTLVLFECNTLHCSGNNLSPWPRSNLFFVYNSVENRLHAPYCGTRPRPEFIATRAHQGWEGLGAKLPGKVQRTAFG
ncbi:ectoine hydroxylase [Proteobacteria bacterium 005FR1]|nr:ectoine hydroxylase [Proteobacteria bacterium 005FR1]